MTTQLTNLLANIVKAQPGSNTPPGEILNTLSQAAQLETAAKVTIARLPEQILAIQVQGQKPLRITLPSVLSTPQVNHPQAASITQGTQSQGILFNTATSNQNIRVSQQQVTSLAQSIAQFIASSTASDQAVTIKGSSPQLNNNVLTLSVGTRQPITLTLSKSNAQTLAPLLHQNSKDIALTLTPSTKADTQGVVNINLSVGAQNSSYIQGPVLSPSDNKLSSIISSALRTQGVALHHHTELPDNIKQLLPNINTNNGVQQVSLLKLQGNSLATYSAVNQAIVKFPLSEPSVSLPALSNQLSQKLILSSIPDATPAVKTTTDHIAAKSDSHIKTPSVKTDNGVAPQPTEKNTTIIEHTRQTQPNQPTDNMQSLKGSDVHRAIISLSRTLLSQTGSTQQALTQLITLLETSSSPKVSGNGDSSNTLTNATQGILKQVSAQLSGINSNTPVTKTPLPQAQPEQPKPAMKPHPDVPSSQVTNTDNNQGRRVLSQLVSLLGESAKHISSNAISNLISNKTPGSAPHPEATQALNNASSKTTSQQAKPDSINLDTVKHRDVKNSPNPPASPDIEPVDEKVTVPAKEPLASKLSSTSGDMTIPARIQALFTSPAMAVTPLALTSPAPASSFVQGLIVLLQLSLAGKALVRQPTLKQLIDMPDSIVSKTLASSGVTGTSSRIVQDMANLDNRSQLLSSLKTLLANHQYSKFAQVENRIQGQDSLYYVLPALSNNSAPPELLVQREPEGNKSAKQHNQKRNIWNITMKLDIGEVGQILAKSKIDGDTLSIDLYTSNEILLHRVADTLPFLKRRIIELGLHIDNMSYQRGHIPETLETRPHQIFETRV